MIAAGFAFTCWSGDIVRGAFIIGARDREIIAWRTVVNAGISGSEIRDIMLEAVERRFNTCRATSLIAVLTDNGAPCIAKQTQIFARQLGLKPCFTPVPSPQSNGMSEAFVKTLKRDGVRVAPLPAAQTVPGLIGSWIEDYNAPRSGQKMRSPREFITAQNATAQVSGEMGARPYDRCPETFFSAIMLAENVLFWLRNSMSLAPGNRLQYARPAPPAAVSDGKTLSNHCVPQRPAAARDLGVRSGTRRAVAARQLQGLGRFQSRLTAGFSNNVPGQTIARRNSGHHGPSRQAEQSRSGRDPLPTGAALPPPGIRADAQPTLCPESG